MRWQRKVSLLVLAVSAIALRSDALGAKSSADWAQPSPGAIGNNPGAAADNGRSDCIKRAAPEPNRTWRRLVTDVIAVTAVRLKIGRLLLSAF